MKLRNELNFENTDRMKEIDAIKGLVKIEFKVDKFL
jgi:hypothetical protein